MDSANLYILFIEPGSNCGTLSHKNKAEAKCCVNDWSELVTVINKIAKTIKKEKESKDILLVLTLYFH